MEKYLALRVRALIGWRRYLVAFLLGAAAATALPPYAVLPALLIAFPGLLWLLDGAGRSRQAFLLGWAFGLGHFLIAFHWLGNAFLVDAEKYAALMPFAVFALAAGMALYPALTTLIAWYIAPAGWQRLLALASAWSASEWLRGHLFTGFPWDPIGVVWIASEALAQSYAYFGVYGVGFLTVLAALSPSYVRRWRDNWVLALAAGLIVLFYAGGWLRLSGPELADVPGVTLRIVQPNIPQREKWQRGRRAANFERHLALSKLTGAKKVTHVIWPETATPFFTAFEPDARRRMAGIVPAGGLLLTGSPRRTAPGPGPIQIWNSLHAIDGKGDIVQTYDKHHLVPFGEYLPFRPILSRLGLDKLAAGSVDYSFGAGPRVLRFGNLPPFQPLICYEAIFAGEIVSPRPAWLLNVTNDAWFGKAAGPAQHLALARIRTIEQGIPMVRAANTGISAVVDAFGRIRARLDSGTAGVIDSPLPAALQTPPLYTRIKDIFPLGIVIILISLLILRIRKQSSATH